MMGCTVGCSYKGDHFLNHAYDSYGEEEDTWISGEELKTEGSSDSDDNVPRRKIKNRRRRSKGFNTESRQSLPNLADNKAGISFRFSQVDERDSKTERFSVGAELTAAQAERSSIESAMCRMSTKSSLDRTEEEGDTARSGSDWRPKRGSLKLPDLEEETVKPKMIRFCDNVEQIEPPSTMMSSHEFGNLDIYPENVLGMCGEGEDTLGENYHKWKESCMGFSEIHSGDAFDDIDIDRYVLKNRDAAEWKPIFKSKLNFPHPEGGNVDLSVKQFVSEMTDFYNEMSGKLKSLKNCPVLENSQPTFLDDDDYNFMQNENFKNLYKNLKKTPKVKKTLSLISRMDSDISETITKFREERAERLEIQKQMMRKIPKDRNSQIFLQLCEFESRSSVDLKTESEERRNETNEARKSNRKYIEDKNFIERNKELAKVGMNFSLSDEQKQRLEKILADELEDIPLDKEDRLPYAVRRANQMSEMNDNVEEEVYTNFTVNAYRMSDEHKERLIGIDSALKEFEELDSGESSESNIRVGLVRSLEEIDEKLKALSASYINDEELLEKTRENPKEMDIDTIEEQLVQNLGNKKCTESNMFT